MLSNGKNTLNSIFEKAEPLSSAAQKFGPYRLRKSYKNPPGLVLLISRTFEATSSSLIPTPTPSELMRIDAAKAELAEWQSSSDALVEMRDYVLKQLNRGKLIAFGFTKDSPINAEPIEIPKRFLKLEWLKWEKDEIRSSERDFYSVRVTRIPSEQLSTIVAPVEKLVKGRPSKEQIIARIIDELTAQGIDFNSMPRDAARGKILEYAERTLKENTKVGFSIPVIQRVLFRKLGHRR